MEKTEGQLASALRLVTGALAATMVHNRIGEDREFAFTGKWEHLGRHTLGHALDVANAALGAPAVPLTDDREIRLQLCALALGWEFRPEIIGGADAHWARPSASGLGMIGEIVAPTAEAAIRHDLEL